MDRSKSKFLNMSPCDLNEIYVVRTDEKKLRVCSVRDLEALGRYRTLGWDYIEPGDDSTVESNWHSVQALIPFKVR